MAFIGKTFAADDLPVSDRDFAPLPDGRYTAKIAGAELRDTKAGTGNYIAIRFDITGPSNEGRVVFGNVTIKNPNATAERIGHEQLGAIMRSIGLDKVEDTDQLIGGELSIKLKIRKSAEYGDSNEVSGFTAISAGSTVPSPNDSKEEKSTSPWAK